MRQFKTITIEEMRLAFSKKDANGKGWEESKVGSEVVFDFIAAPNCTIRVWTSIRIDNGMGRDRGQDAIRVAAFNPQNNCGLVKSAIVQRIDSWQANLRIRIREVAATARKRLAAGFDGRENGPRRQHQEKQPDPETQEKIGRALNWRETPVGR